MLAPEGFQSFSRVHHTAFSHILAALPDAFFGVGLGREIEQTLIGFRVLHDGGGLIIDGQHHRALRFFKLLKKRGGRFRNVVSA